MLTKKDLIGNTLLKEIITIRTDTLWRMLDCLKNGRMPEINEEGASGKLDNKGAIFIPGGLVYQDVDEKKITYEVYGNIVEKDFRKRIRESMRFDNATLLFPDGIAKSVNLDGGFFARAAKCVYAYNTGAFKRIRKIGRKLPVDVDAIDIIRSHCPTYVDPPYGSRTRISTCASIGLIDPHMYFAYCKTEFNLSSRRLHNFSKDLDVAQDQAELADGTVLYPPFVVVCHDTRYKENSLTGMVRILGIGKFGEFSTFTIERMCKPLMGEMKRKKVEYGNEHVFAELGGEKAVGILRTYGPTNPGKRSLKYRFDLISPEKDVGIDLVKIRERARKRYQIDLASE